MPVFGLRAAGLPVSTGFQCKPTRSSCFRGQGGSEYIYIRGVLSSLKIAGFLDFDRPVYQFPPDFGPNRLDQRVSAVEPVQNIYRLMGFCGSRFWTIFDQNFDYFFLKIFLYWPIGISKWSQIAFPASAKKICTFYKIYVRCFICLFVCYWIISKNLEFENFVQFVEKKFYFDQ